MLLFKESGLKSLFVTAFFVSIYIL